MLKSIELIETLESDLVNVECVTRADAMREIADEYNRGLINNDEACKLYQRANNAKHCHVLMQRIEDYLKDENLQRWISNGFSEGAWRRHYRKAAFEIMGAINYCYQMDLISERRLHELLGQLNAAVADLNSSEYPEGIWELEDEEVEVD